MKPDVKKILTKLSENKVELAAADKLKEFTSDQTLKSFLQKTN